MENQTLEVKPMNWIEIRNSSAMSYYAYDPASQTLAIKTPGGTPYFYLDVPADMAAKFDQAVSKGKFWITHIKPRFQCRKGDGELAKQSPTDTPVHPKVEKIIVSEGEKAATPLALSMAAIDVAVVRPFGEMVSNLRMQMSTHCLGIQTELNELTKLAIRTTVTDGESYAAAVKLGNELAERRRGIADMMQPTKRAMDSVKKVILDKEKELLDLAAQGEIRLKSICTTWRTEQERIKNEAAAAERQRLLKVAEDSRIAQAEQAHEAGRTQLAERLLDTPVTAPAVKVEQAVPKTTAKARVNYRWRLTRGASITRLPEDWLQLNESAIGKYARENKLPEGTIVHGIEFFQEADTNF